MSCTLNDVQLNMFEAELNFNSLRILRTENYYETFQYIILNMCLWSVSTQLQNTFCGLRIS